MGVADELFRIYDAGGEFLGTGVLVTERLLLTCAHVVGKGEPFMAARKEEAPIPARVIRLEAREEVDLALLDLGTRFGTPMPWLHESRGASAVTLAGFHEGSQADLRTIPCTATPHIIGGWVDSWEVPQGVYAGMSGGVAVVQIGLELRYAGQIQWGGKRASKSLLAGPRVVAEFLAKEGLQLAGCPEWVGGKPADPFATYRKAYLEQVRNDTAQIDIRGFQTADNKAKSFPIEDLFVGLMNHEEEEMETVIAGHRCLVVQGGAGSGKSTFLQYLAHRWSVDGELFPLPIRVTELERTVRKNLDEAGFPCAADDARWVAIHLAAGALGIPVAFFEHQLAQAGTAVLLDGLDEAGNESGRREMVALLDRASERYPRCRFILTTRPGAYVGASRTKEFRVESIAPLDKEAIQRFFANWSRCIYPGNPAAAEDHCKDLAAQARGTAAVEELAKSPMTLTALASIHWNERRLPQDRAELYESVLTWQVRSREKKPGRPGEAECRRLLGRLAFGMQTWPAGRLKQAEVDEAAKILQGKLSRQETEEFLERESLDSGIVEWRGGRYEFRHLTYQEYLAAKELLGNYSDAEQLALLREGPRYAVEWREFLRLFALQCGERKAEWVYRELLDMAGGELADRARTVALVRKFAQDRREREEAIPEPYLQFVRQMAGLFRGEADGKGLDQWSRAEAAEAWELLALDDRRLVLPSAEEYWVTVDGKFALGRCPVTVHEYGVYLVANSTVQGPDNWALQQRFPLRPVVRVNHHEASAYCQWWSGQTARVVRLPTDAEWLLAAAGSGRSGRGFPWGEEPPGDEHANFEMRTGRITPVGLFPTGATPEGVLDLAGNDWEWMASYYNDSKRTFSLRGGSYYSNARSLRSAVRLHFVPGDRNDVIGFRCLRE
jgi:hypothetical protein